MKRKGYVCTMLLCALACIFLFGCDDSSGNISNVKVNIGGDEQSETVRVKEVEGGVLVDAQALAALITDLEFYRTENPPNPGIVLQYGKRLSFVSAGFTKGIYTNGTVEMNPPLEISEDLVYWTPLNFISATVSKKNPDTDPVIELINDNTVISVNVEPAAVIGSIVPETKTIADQLVDDFDIRQGEISLTSAIDIYTGGYLPDCNGNNATNSYLVTKNPLSPRATVFNRLPLGFYMDQDEAFIWVGKTPPETKYFSYQHYLMNRVFTDEEPPLKKIYARLGDSFNNLNIPLGDDPYNQFFVMIFASNKDTHAMVKDAIIKAGISEEKILTLILPGEVGQFGQGPVSDAFTFLHRATLFADQAEKDEYTKNPPLEILRLTPKAELPTNPMDRPTPRERKTGVKEQDDTDLGLLLEDLRTSIIAKHSGDYKYTRELKTSTWMFPGGDVAIEARENVLGETNDTLYLKSEIFTLNEDDLIVVYGSNHDLTGKSLYSNVSCYGTKALNGVGGISSTASNTPGTSYFGSAASYLPDAEEAAQNSVFAYKFARTEIDDFTYAIADNQDGTFTGHNNGDTVYMGFRMYVDKDTTIGPYPGNTVDGQYFTRMGPDGSEVFFDQVIVFSNTSEN